MHSKNLLPDGYPLEEKNNAFFVSMPPLFEVLKKAKEIFPAIPTSATIRFWPANGNLIGEERLLISLSPSLSEENKRALEIFNIDGMVSDGLYKVAGLKEVGVISLSEIQQFLTTSQRIPPSQSFSAREERSRTERDCLTEFMASLRYWIKQGIGDKETNEKLLEESKRIFKTGTYFETVKDFFNRAAKDLKLPEAKLLALELAHSFEKLRHPAQYQEDLYSSAFRR